MRWRKRRTGGSSWTVGCSQVSHAFNLEILVIPVQLLLLLHLLFLYRERHGAQTRYGSGRTGLQVS